MRKLLLGLAALLMITVIVVVAGWRFLHSETGNRWLVEQAVDASGGALSIEGVEGRLDDRLTARSVTWEQDGLRVDVEDVALSGEVSVWPPAVTLRTASVGSVRVQQDATAETPGDETDWPQLLEGLVAPVPVTVANWELGPVDLVGGEGDARRVLNAASGSLRWDDALVLPSLAWDAPTHAGQGTVDLGLRPPFRHALELEAAVPALERSPEVRVSLAGTGAETRLSAVAEGQDRLGIEGVVERPLEAPGLQFELATERYEVAPGLVIEPLRMQLDGPVGALQIEGEGRLLAEDAPATPWAMRGRWDGSRLTIESLTVQAGGREYVGNGVISLPPGGVHVAPLVFASEDGDVRLEGEVHLDRDTEQVEVELAWRELTWPLDGGEDAWRSPRGRVTAQGVISAWSGTAEFDLLAPGIPEAGAVELTAEGDQAGSRFGVTGRGALMSELQGTGRIDWGEALRLAWDGSATGVNLGPLLEQWPSSIDASVRYTLDAGVQTIELDSLGGTLRGEALSGQGRARTRAGRWDFDAVRLGVGTAQVSLDGAWPADRLTLETTIPPGSAPARWFGLDARGSASVDLSATPPTVEARLAGGRVQVGEYTLGAWALEGDSAGRGLTLETAVPGDEAEGAGQVTGTLRTSEEGFDLEARVAQGTQSLLLGIETDLIDWGQSPALTGLDVTGRLTELVATQDEDPLFTLDAPASFRYAEGEVSVTEVCGRLLGDGSACFLGDATAAGAFSLEARLDALRLAPVTALFGVALIPNQVVSGELSLQRVPGTLPSGLLALDVTAGSLQDPEVPDNRLDTGPARVDLVLEEGQVRSGVLELPLPGVGRIDGSLEATDVRLDGTGQLRGRGRFDVADLGSLAVLLPDLERISGGMGMELDLSGSLAEPVLDGLVRLENVTFSIPYLGLTVSDLNGEGFARGQGEAAFQADFRVGEGAGRLLADVDLTPGKGWPFIFRVEGENLRLVETPDIELDANPAFDLSWADGAWTIDGMLEVPRLRLTPRSTLVGQVSESEDVVIVAGTPPAAAPPPIYANDVFYGQLELVLGEDITLETDEAEAQVGGGLTLSWNGPPEPVAEGALTVTGEIEVFGPVLRISDGNLRFPGVPVSNPVLDLRAERDIFGNTQIRAAGVAIGGTARRPTIEAYTRPFTTRDRAWALLITGQDFDQGQSISALEVGAYIAPRIYVSYGVSLFDDENVASVRYDFSRGFGIKATSGVRQTGVDISYTIEND